MKKQGFGDSSFLSRRDAFRLAPLAAAAGLPAPVLAQRPAESAPLRARLNRFPRMLQEYFVERVSQIHRERLARLAALATKADAEAYVGSVREKIASALGPLPPKTPLNARVTGVLERETYKIEKVIFESRPGFLVTANLYVPKGRTLPLPAVVGTCGHTDNGKAGEAYQSFAQGLARLGYVVLLYDPIGQGERLQYVDENLKPLHGIGTREHTYTGNQQHLVGESFSFWRAWDGIRALDYLLTRDEVDHRHLGVTGNSGGGTLTTWLCGLDQRWTMAAPSCFVTEIRRNLENELAQDSEQCPPKVLALGLDHADFLAALAPKPIIILGKERDFFDVRGTEAAYSGLKRLYGLLGAADNLALYIGPTEHGYSRENREAMYQWFNRATGISEAKTEPELVMEEERTLWCTPQGQVADLESQPLYVFTRRASSALRRRRLRLDGPALRKKVVEVLRIAPDSPAAPRDYRILRPLGDRGYRPEHAITYLVPSESGISAVVYRLTAEQWLSRPPAGRKRAVLYVSHLSSDEELRDEPLIGDIMNAEPESELYTCDVRGIGDSEPNTCGSNNIPDPHRADYFYSAYSIMLDRPYVGGRTRDVLAALDWLRETGHAEVHLVARGWGAVPAAFAALLSNAVVQVTLKNALTSYTEVAEATDYNWPLALLVPGILKQFDLPDIYRELEAKDLRLIEPWGANPRVV